MAQSGHIPPAIPRGSVIKYLPGDGLDAHYYVLLTDVSTLPERAQPPMVGAVLLAQKDLPANDLYPSIAGTGASGNGLNGVWRVRGDKPISLYAGRLIAAGPVTPPELAAIDTAVQRFLDV